jgi:hypothetical protein
MQMHGLGATKSRLRNLLRYTDELLSFNEKVAFGCEFIACVKRARRIATRFSMAGLTLDFIQRLTSRRSLQQSAFSASQ